MKKFMALVCAATGFLAISQQAIAAERILDFEGLDYDLAPGSVGTFTNYGGLNWTNGHPNLAGWINVRSAGECSAPCGFVAGLTSGVQVGAQVHGMTSTISGITPFRAVSVRVSSAWRNGEQVTFTGFLNNVQVWSSNYILDLVGPGANPATLVNFNSGLIDELRVTSTGGTLLGLGGSSVGAVLDDFRYDDLVGTGAVPEPATWAMMLAGFGMLGAAMRRSRQKVRTAVAFD